jgi:hypothetical protein
MSAGEPMLYVSCAGSREIVRFAMDRESGRLGQGRPYEAGAVPGRIEFIDLAAEERIS